METHPGSERLDHARARSLVSRHGSIRETRRRNYRGDARPSRRPGQRHVTHPLLPPTAAPVRILLRLDDDTTVSGGEIRHSSRRRRKFGERRGDARHSRRMRARIHDGTGKSERALRREKVRHVFHVSARSSHGRVQFTHVSKLSRGHGWRFGAARILHEVRQRVLL